jgi:hypothetical protein
VGCGSWFVGCGSWVVLIRCPPSDYLLTTLPPPRHFWLMGGGVGSVGGGCRLAREWWVGKESGGWWVVGGWWLIVVVQTDGPVLNPTHVVPGLKPRRHTLARLQRRCWCCAASTQGTCAQLDLSGSSEPDGLAIGQVYEACRYRAHFNAVEGVIDTDLLVVVCVCVRTCTCTCTCARAWVW